MLKLKKKKSGPFWMSVADGVRVQLKPERASLMVAIGRAAAAKVLAEDGTPQEASEAFTIAVAQWGIIAWEGIGDEKGKALPVAPDHVEQLLTENWAIYHKLDQDYVMPVLLLDAEKNGSSPSPTGTSAAAKATARTAPRAAKSARTTKTPAKPKRAKTPGK